MSVSQPSASFPSQSTKPSAQVVMVQTPEVHVVVALGALHVLPQLPQLAGSVSRFVHSVAHTVLQNVMPTFAEPFVETAPPLPGDIAREMLAVIPDTRVTGVGGLVQAGGVVAFTALHFAAYAKPNTSTLPRGSALRVMVAG
jgi:hypothetical protein